jgi:hypothetical protein
MNSLMFARLGFKIDTKLSKIKDSELGFSLNEPKLNDTNSDILTALTTKISSYQKLLNDPSNLQPYIKRGYEYYLKNEDPTIKEMVEDFDSEGFNNNYLQSHLNEIDVPNPSKAQLKIVTEVFISVAKGYATGNIVTRLSNLHVVAKKNSAHFSKIKTPIELGKLENELKMAELLNECGFTIESTLKEYEQRLMEIEGLKKEYSSIKTPDKRKTIADRIETIAKKIKEPENKVWDTETLHRIGYLIAIRGENPTLFELLKQNKIYIEGSPWHISGNDFKGDAISNSKKILQYIMEGYSYSYHISFLEEELQKIGTSENETFDKSIKLKWQGQKNQLYDVIRTLKSKGLIGNSYEELAVFIRQNIDSFQNTALSTIQKEVGKNKRPPKAKRINLD